MTFGYRHPQYIKSLEEFGQPIELARSGAWLLKRAIPDSKFFDAIGPYPLFSCANWGQLADDLEDLKGELVSVCLVSHPFDAFDPTLAAESFPDLMQAYKEHFVVDLQGDHELNISKHHKRYAKKAISELRIEPHESPIDLLEQWINLYQQLIKRHDIHGIAQFSRDSFAKQLQIPGLRAFTAKQQNEILGAALFFENKNFASYHLGAYSKCGYAKKASFGIFWKAIEYYQKRGFKWLHLGAGAGKQQSVDDGLSTFKSGWTKHTRTAYLCGKILIPEIYTQLNSEASKTEYFPTYRAPR